MLLRHSFTKIVSSLALLSLLPDRAFALPEGSSVESGKVEISSSKSSMEFKVSDKAIINYESFSIGKKEKVKFIQPSSSSVALNRVRGKNVSEILGKLESNGRIFLVNPNGVFFGPSAKVNVGSIVVSTLDLASSDFLKDNYRFTLTDGSKGSKIINQGSLNAEGSIALLAPIIQNEGVIEAKAGSVLLASAEMVTLDFTGDGLLSFGVEGDLEEAIIKQSGTIKASEGDVFLKLKVAEKAIKAVVNTDGVEEGEIFIEENGVIKLVSKSFILANNITVSSQATEVAGSIKASKSIIIEGSKDSSVFITGNLDASNTSSKSCGGVIQILADEIRLEKAILNASGDAGGGTVLIGGDFQGKGDLFRSRLTSIDKDSSILADAIKQGSGGDVVIWSDGATIFEGKVWARGGKEFGNGGVVETSGKEQLQVLEKAYVNTLAPKGKIGDWLLDPVDITVVASGGTGSLVDAANCALGTTGFTIDASTINAAGSNVVLCATSSITLNAGAPINIAAGGVGIEFRASGGGAVTTTLNDSISTNGGLISFGTDASPGTTQNLVLGTSVTLAGGGAAFDCPISGPFNLTVNIPTGPITFSPNASINIGLSAGSTSLSLITIVTPITLNNTVTLTGGLSFMTAGGAFRDLVLTNTTSVGGSFIFRNLTTNAGTYNVAFLGGGGASGTFSFGHTGTLTFSGAPTFFGPSPLDTTTAGTVTSVRLSGSLSRTVTTQPFTFGSPTQSIVLLGNTSLSTVVSGTGSTITLGGNISGAFDLALDSGTANITIGGSVVTNIGASPTTISLDVISATPTFALGSSTTLAGGLRVRNVALSPSNLGIPGPLTVPGPITVGGIVTASSAIAISLTGGGTISGTASFTNTGQLSLGGVSGSDLNFASNLSVSAPSQLNLSGTLNFASATAPTFAVPTNLALDTTITTVNTNISLNGNISGAHNLALYTPGGNTTLGPGVSISIGDAAGNISLDVRSNATFGTNGPVTLVGGLKVTTNGTTPQDFGAGSTLIVGGEISVGGFLTGAGAFNISLLGGGTISGSTNLLNTGITTLHGGTPNLSLFSNLSTTTASSTHISGTILQNDSAETITMGTVVLDANATLQTNNGAITINGL